MDRNSELKEAALITSTPLFSKEPAVEDEIEIL